MSKRMIEKHPLDVLDKYLAFYAMLDYEIDLDDDERRYIAEHNAVNITESSSLEECALAVSKLASIHVPQLNARLKDMNTSQHYSNPVELIREESKRRENKKVWYSGNIAYAHERIKSLKKDIVLEETRGQMLKSLFWWLLFGLGFLALGIYSCCTGAAVSFANKVIDSTWFHVIFALVTLGLSFFFGFFAIGVLIVGIVFLLVWVIIELPGLTAVILNGAIFLIAGILLLVAIAYVENIIKYKPLTEEERRLNQERIDEKETLCRELEEYSDTMVAKLDIMKQKFMGNESAFVKEMRQYLGDRFEAGAVYEIFSFLNRYYRKMKK